MSDRARSAGMQLHIGELKAPLATFDRKLAEAARRYLGSLRD